MQKNELNKNEQIQKLTRNQILHYIAEMSEEMSKLAATADCAELAQSLKTSAHKAHNLLPQGYED